MHIGIGSLASLADELSGFLAMGILTIADVLFHICLCEQV